MYDHTPSPITKTYKWKNPTCVVCSMEESVKRKILGVTNTKGRQYARRRKHLSVCDNTDCSMVCHTFCPPESRMRLLPQFATMSCFQIAHHPECQNLFYDVHRNGQIYTRSLVNHAMIPKVQSLYECDVPRRSDRSRK